MLLRLTTAVIAVALCAAFGALGAETNAASPTLKKQAPFTAGIDTSKENEMLLSESAKAAINAGMPTLAKSILEDNIKKSPQLANSDNINTLLLDSLIALGEYKNADEVFSRIKDGSGPAYRIRKALIDAGLGRADISRSVNYTPVAKVANLGQTIDELKEKGIWFVCADMDGEVMYRQNLTGPIGLVIGNEGNGVSRLVKEKCDFTTAIPMNGDIDSLNASVAAGVLAFEIVRQRMAK